LKGCLAVAFVPFGSATHKRELDMRFGKSLLAAAAISMAATPALAAPANVAASLSVAQSARVGSATSQKNELAGGGIVIAVLAVAAVIAGIVIIADDNDSPDSP
jgi:hypothetical protein